MNDDGLEALRAAVDEHTGPARTQPLQALGQALAQRYWRVGPGTPAAAPLLDEAIRVLDEAYGYLEPGEFQRGMQAGTLGWLYGIRHVAHGSPADDRERGIMLLDEALGFAQLPSMLQLVARVVLGQLLLSRVTSTMRSPDFAMRAMRSGLAADERASADRAVACFRQVVDAPQASAELTAMARLMLGLAEALQAMAGGLGAGPGGGLDLGRMMQAMAGLQTLQQQAAAPSPGGGFGQLPNLFDFAADDLAPSKRPVTVIEGAVPAPGAATPVRPASAPAAPAATFRTALFDLLPGTGFAAVLELLDRGPAEIGVGTVDELVALAGSLVHAADAVGTDRLLLAVALYLRGVLDEGGGWGDESDADDVAVARGHLLAAAEAVCSEQADAVAVAFRLATLLDEREPARGVRERLAERFDGVTKALRTVGAGGLLYPVGDRMLLLSAQSGALSAAGEPLPERLLVAGDAFVNGRSTVSYVRSGAQVIELAGRSRRPLTESAVFVANPRGDRKHASMDALILRRAFYPRSAGLGETVENADGPGTPDEVRRGLDASLLHLGCGLTPDGSLELAGSTVLTPAEIAAGPPAATGGLAVLPAAAGAAALTDALLASRFTGVIGFRRPVPDDVASLVNLVLHERLVDAGSDPATAVAAVRSWLSDPDRTPPDHLPPWLADRAVDPDLTTYGDAPAHYGV